MNITPFLNRYSWLSREKISKRVSSSRPFIIFLFVSAIIFLFAGCAARQPLSVPLTPPEEQSARELLSRLINTPCPDFIDADLTLTWQGYGQQRTVRIGLQAAKDGRIRASGFDPLSRPFFIFVTDGHDFTIVDSRQGRGYTGSLNSKLIRSYLPRGVSGKTLFLLLAGRLIDDHNPTDIVLLHGDDMENYYRYSFIISDGNTLHSEINTDSGLLSRQFILDKNDEIIIDTRYAGSVPVGSDCLPRTLEVEGEAITGVVRIVFDKVYGDGGTTLDDRVFLLQIPAHFTATEVE